MIVKKWYEITRFMKIFKNLFIINSITWKIIEKKVNTSLLTYHTFVVIFSIYKQEKYQV